MSLIRNLIKEPESDKLKRKEAGSDGDPEEGQKMPRPVIKSATDLQRLRLEKLMKNPDKPVIIPEPRKEKDYMQTVPTFVRNVMGSSAGAGSGEFHVYRHLRRKEYARQKTIQAKSLKEQQDEEFQHKLEVNRRDAEQKTAKKRAKRLKKKARAKKQRQNLGDNKESLKTAVQSSSDESESDRESNNIESKRDTGENEQHFTDAEATQTGTERDDNDFPNNTQKKQASMKNSQ